jgi:hypothetical protein
MEKDRQDYKKSCSASTHKAEEEAKNGQNLITIFDNKQPRITPEEVVMFNEEVEKLENLIKSITDQNQTNYVHENSTMERINLLKDGMNTTHLPKIQERLESYTNTRDRMVTILTKEKELDVLLGEIIAELHNNHDPSKFQICMSNHEFAIFLYYMSLTGFISSNKTFLNSYLTNLQEDSKVNVARQIYMVFLQRSAVDNEFIDPDTDTFTEEMKDTLVKMYSHLMKLELNKLFETQMSNLRNPSFMTMLMGELGIDGYNILDGLLEVGYEHYFGQIASALLAVLGFTAGAGILASILTVFLVWLSSKVVQEIVRICKDDEEYELYKASFYKHMTDVYRYFFLEDIYSLDYKTIIKQEKGEKNNSMKDILRYPIGSLSDNLYNILDSIYTGPEFFVDTKVVSGGRLVMV